MCRAGGLANLIQQLQHVSGEERQEIVHGSFEFKIWDRVDAGRQDGDGLWHVGDCTVEPWRRWPIWRWRYSSHWTLYRQRCWAAGTKECKFKVDFVSFKENKEYKTILNGLKLDEK